MNTPMIPRFSIFKPYSNEKVDTLKHCFIKRNKMKRNDLPSQICADDGLVYQAVYDSRIPQTEEFFDVVISFQEHSYGRFAIIRVAKDQQAD